MSKLAKWLIWIALMIQGTLRLTSGNTDVAVLCFGVGAVLMRTEDKEESK